MEIVAGAARGMELTSPAETDEVRPTSVRARKAFFDSLGTIDGLIFADVFAGSGAMGLEAASRGAAKVYFFERTPSVVKMIEKNCNRIRHTSVQAELELIRGAVPPFRADLQHRAKPDIVFADPPYPLSMDLFKKVTADPVFQEWASDAIFFWELPDRDCNLEIPSEPWKIIAIRNFGQARFLELKCAKK